MSNIDILKDELTNDPLGRGYAGMTDEQAADDLNTAYRSRNRANMSASEVLNAVDATEYGGLTNQNKDRFWQLMSIGELNPFGVEATLMVNLFGSGSNTISTLAGLRTESISRAQELGIDVKVGLVEEARR